MGPRPLVVSQVSDFGFEVRDFGFGSRVSVSGFGFGLRASVSGFGILFRISVSGLGFGVTVGGGEDALVLPRRKPLHPRRVLLQPQVQLVWGFGVRGFISH